MLLCTAKPRQPAAVRPARRVYLEVAPDGERLAALEMSVADFKSGGTGRIHLTRQRRQSIELRRFAGLSFEEITTATQWPISAVAERLRATGGAAETLREQKLYERCAVRRRSERERRECKGTLS